MTQSTPGSIDWLLDALKVGGDERNEAPSQDSTVTMTLRFSSPEERRRAADKILATGHLTVRIPVSALSGQDD